MNLEKNKNQDLTAFIESIVKLPPWIKHYSLNHHSPSQINKPDGPWSYEYLYLTQEQRRKLEGNSKMNAGISIGTAAQLLFGDYEWQGSKKIEIIKKNKGNKKTFEAVLELFNKYTPVSDKDEEQHNENRKGLSSTFYNLKTAIEEVKLKKPIECERTVSMTLPGCILPCIGRIDLEDSKKFIELKTKWKVRRVSRNKLVSFSVYKIKEVISPEHLLQVAFYHLATGKKPYLVIVDEADFKIFTHDIHEPPHFIKADELHPDNLKKIVKKMSMVASRRERLMERHAGKSTFVQDVEPAFEHPFYWNFGGNHKEEAKKLWGL